MLTTEWTQVKYGQIWSCLLARISNWSLFKSKKVPSQCNGERWSTNNNTHILIPKGNTENLVKLTVMCFDCGKETVHGWALYQNANSMQKQHGTFLLQGNGSNHIVPPFHPWNKVTRVKCLYEKTVLGLLGGGFIGRLCAESVFRVQMSVLSEEKYISWDLITWKYWKNRTVVLIFA